MPFASFSLGGIDMRGGGTSVVLNNLPATLTAQGAESFAGYYTAGSTLDPVDLSVALTADANLPDDNDTDPTASTAAAPRASARLLDMELIARGRDADVYALDESRVLRRYRRGGPTEREARLMTHLAGCGYPVPKVYEVTGTDMVLERLTGPTMLEALARRPWQVGSLGRALGGLHDRLHALPAPQWLPRRFATAGDDRVLHLDLHPGNVLLTGRGPVVIDWSNAGAGDPAADVAMTMVTVGSAEVPGLTVRLGRSLLTHSIRKGCRTDPRPLLRDAAEAKLTDPNLRPAEAAWLRRRVDDRPRGLGRPRRPRGASMPP